MQDKDTLKWYRDGKTGIQYDQCYTNNLSSKIYARARTNTLQVEEFKRRGNRNHNTICKLCGLEEEDLQHFIIDCPRSENKRNREVMNKWRNMDKHRQMVDVLFNEKNYEKISQMLRGMWLYRKDLLRPL